MLNGIELHLHQNLLYWLSPSTSLEQFLRAIWGAVFWAVVLILPQIKLNSQLSSCASFWSTETSIVAQDNKVLFVSCKNKCTGGTLRLKFCLSSNRKWSFIFHYIFVSDGYCTPSALPKVFTFISVKGFFVNKISHSLYTNVGEVCNFLGSVLPQQKFEVMDSVTAQFYLGSKRKYILKVWGWVNPKDSKRREAPGSIFGSSFYVLSPPPEPTLCKSGWPGGMFVLPEVLPLVLGPSFVLFSRAFPFFVF